MEHSPTLPDTCAPKYYADFNGVLDCLSHIKEDEKTWADRQSCTVKIIYDQIGRLYSSDVGFLRDSEDTVQSWAQKWQTNPLRGEFTR